MVYCRRCWGASASGRGGVNTRTAATAGVSAMKKTIIAPAVERANSEGDGCVRPVGDDTLFVRSARRPPSTALVSCVTAMHHDQGHIAPSCWAAAGLVNIRDGLPMRRTSVDHGTAYGHRWRGVADGRVRRGRARSWPRAGRGRRASGLREPFCSSLCVSLQLIICGRTTTGEHPRKIRFHGSKQPTLKQGNHCHEHNDLQRRFCQENATGRQSRIGLGFDTDEVEIDVLIELYFPSLKAIFENYRKRRGDLS